MSDGCWDFGVPKAGALGPRVLKDSQVEALKAYLPEAQDDEAQEILDNRILGNLKEMQVRRGRGTGRSDPMDVGAWTEEQGGKTGKGGHQWSSLSALPLFACTCWAKCYFTGAHPGCSIV